MPQIERLYKWMLPGMLPGMLRGLAIPTGSSFV